MSRTEPEPFNHKQRKEIKFVKANGDYLIEKANYSATLLP